MDFAAVVEGTGKAIDLAGVAVIVVGALAATVTYVSRVLRRSPAPDLYREYRLRLGKAILLGLEFLVAGDIIRTVAISPTFQSVGVLAVIVAVRTFLSFSLGVELEGRLPWQRARPDHRPAGPPA
ncbi:hypothetical protein Ssi03_39600 [Sphaerisporangium siamense]|uniref:Putative membrane protein n=1 Tax=Sphaerisporangium siamense TaxID=795645 RepID=A0A7W7GBD3_9ACTN|nr:DUF1622 domain-containing protein [Sphaerisporangium siamense]MBB4700886.1 putative membrane protein [Sphaerisporangium siamense]GII85970.1 hypothetical protein Ssi03_39600 [Sphaerisporangium siamense]